MKIALSTLAGRACRALGLAGLAAGVLAFAAPADARTQVVPYLEVEQVLSADLNGGDVLTYSTLAAGVDAHTKTRRVEAQMSYRYERRIAWEGDLADEDVHSGLAAIRAEIVPNTVAINAGALATRARSDGGAPIFGFGAADDPTLADVYSVYAGPDVSTQIGPLDVAASYRLGYVKVDDHGLAGGSGPFALDRYDSSINHSASLSVGMGPGELPFGWTVGAGWTREDVDRLDQEYESRFVRGDVVFPVTPTLALTAGVGYEDIEASQQDIRRDENGLPILSPGGRLIADPSRPRLLSYEESGLIWDAGVIWRPSRRTEVQARVGRRYGDTTFVGSFRHQLNSAYSITGSVYDAVDSFGRIIVADLASVTPNFRVRRNPLNPGVGGPGGCIFGNDPGTGTCLDDAFQAISTSNFRHRGASILFSGGRGPWSMGVGAGYSQRKYFEPRVEDGFDLDRFKDESFGINGYLSRDLSRTSSVGFDAYATWFDRGLPGVGSSFGAGASGSYYQRLFFDRLEAQAALGIYTTSSDLEDSTGIQGLIGLRYSF